MVQARVEAPVRPTEVPERVVAACTRFFPDARVHVERDRVEAQATELDDLRRRIWELRIIDAFRSRLLAGVDGGTVRFTLGKQAAYAGRLSFPPTPHGLGDLHVTLTVEAGDPWADGEALAWWLCPETRDGEVVEPGSD